MNKAKLATCYEGPLLHVFHNPFNYSYILFITTDFQLQLYDMLSMSVLARSEKPIWSYSDPPLKFIQKYRQKISTKQTTKNVSVKGKFAPHSQPPEKQSSFNKPDTFFSQEKYLNNFENLENDKQKKDRERKKREDCHDQDFFVHANKEEKIVKQFNRVDKISNNQKRFAKENDNIEKCHNLVRQMPEDKLQDVDYIRDQERLGLNQGINDSINLQSDCGALIQKRQQKQMNLYDVQQHIQDKYNSENQLQIFNAAQISESRKNKEHSQQSENYRNQPRNDNQGNERDQYNKIRKQLQQELSKDLEQIDQRPINQTETKNYTLNKAMEVQKMDIQSLGGQPEHSQKIDPQSQQAQQESNYIQKRLVVQNYALEDWSCVFSYDLNCFYIFSKGYIWVCRIKAGIIQFDRRKFPSPLSLLQQLEIFAASQNPIQQTCKNKIRIEAVSLFDKNYIVGFIKNKLFILRQSDVQKQIEARRIKRQIEKSAKKSSYSNMREISYEKERLLSEYEHNLNPSSNKKNHNKRRENRLKQFEHNFMIVGRTIESMGVKLPASNSMIRFRRKRKNTAYENEQQDLIRLDGKTAKYRICGFEEELSQCKQITLLNGDSNKRDKYWICLSKLNQLIVYQLKKPINQHQQTIGDNQDEDGPALQQLGRVNVTHIYNDSQRKLFYELSVQYLRKNNKQFKFTHQQTEKVKALSKLKIEINNRTRRLMKTSDPLHVVIYNRELSEVYAIHISHLKKNMDIERPDFKSQGMTYYRLQKQISNSIIQFQCIFSPNTMYKDQRFYNTTCEVKRQFLSMCFFQLGIDTSTKCDYDNDLYLISLQKIIKKKQNDDSNIKNTKDLIQTKHQTKKGRPAKNKQKGDKQQIGVVVAQSNSQSRQIGQGDESQLFIYRLFEQKIILLHKINLIETPESDIWSNPSVANHIFYIANQNCNGLISTPFPDNIRQSASQLQQELIKKPVKPTLKQQLQVSDRKNGQELSHFNSLKSNSGCNENDSQSDTPPPCKKIRMINILRSCTQQTIMHDNTHFNSSKLIAEHKLDVLISKDIGQQWVCLGFRFEALRKNDIYQQCEDEFDEIKNEEQNTYEEHSGDDIMKMLNTFDDPFVDQEECWRENNAIDCRVTSRKF